MFGLPDSTERIRPLHKSEFFAHFGIRGKDRAQFDAEVAKMAFAAHVSPDTIPALSDGGRGATALPDGNGRGHAGCVTLPGDNGRGTRPACPPHGFWVLRMELKVREASPATIALVASNVRQNIVFALQRGDETQFAVAWRSRVLRTAWMKTREADIPLSGQDAETAWLNVVAYVGGTTMDVGVPREEREDALERQFAEREQRERILSEIARLEKACSHERQMRRRYELHRQTQQLKAELQPGRGTRPAYPSPGRVRSPSAPQSEGEKQ